MLLCPLCDAPIDEEEDELDQGDSLICEQCGVNLVVSSVDPIELEKEVEEIEELEEEEELEDQSPPDLGSRILCSDGACIGIIGPDGKCKECGQPMAEEDAPLLAASLAREEQEADEDEEDDDWEEEEEDESPPDDLDDRELCADGSCIGVIGPDGRCKECGRAAGDEPSEEEEAEEPAEEVTDQEEPAEDAAPQEKPAGEDPPG